MPYVCDWQYEVFISHAGTVKPLAELLQSELRRLGIKAFVDKRNLHAGDHSEEIMITAADVAPVGVALFNRDYFERNWPIHELVILTEKDTLLPVLHGEMTHKEYEKLLRGSPEGRKLFPDSWDHIARKVRGTGTFWLVMLFVHVRISCLQVHYMYSHTAVF